MNETTIQKQDDKYLVFVSHRLAGYLYQSAAFKWKFKPVAVGGFNESLDELNLLAIYRKCVCLNEQEDNKWLHGTPPEDALTTLYDNWVYEESSGYHGWRCRKCGTWIRDGQPLYCKCNRIK